VESHIGDYQRLIDNLQGEVVRLKARVKQAEANAVRNDHDDRSVSRRSAGGLGGRGFEFRDASPTSRDASTLVGSLSARQPDGRLISGSVANAKNVPNRKPVAFPPSRAALERLLESFRENAEERLETQKNLYEHEDENARVRFFLQSDGALESEAERKKCVVAVAENEAACLRYRTEIDVSDRAARALAERTKDLVSALPGFGFGHSRDARLEDERDGNEDDRESRAAVASALADALLRGRDAENAAAEAEFFLDVRESVIAEQRDAIDALVEATRGFVLRDRAGGEFLNPASENDRQRALALVSDALRKKALGERRIAFWDHQFEPPTTNANVHAAERETSETAYAYGDEKARRENETKRATHEDASRNVSPRVERVELSRKQTRVFEKRAVARDSRNSLSRRPGSGGGRAGSGRRLSSSSASELLRANGAKSETRARGIKKEEERLHEPQPRPESRESAGSGGSRASSGATTTSAVSVLSFRERSERSARAYTRGVAGKSKAPRKPPVSASGVHGSGSRLRLMQRDAFALRTSRSAETGANANGSGASDKNKNRRMVLHEPNESRAERQGLSPRGFSGRGASRRDVDVFGASGPRRFDHSISTARLNARAPVSPSRVTRRGGPQSARVSQRASPHSPAKRKPEQVTPEAFIIARPGR
jgi:hypothetical protein